MTTPSFPRSLHRLRAAVTAAVEAADACFDETVFAAAKAYFFACCEICKNDMKGYLLALAPEYDSGEFLAVR